MKEEYYLIGEVSKITGVSKDTLHFYSKTGLLVPDYTDPHNQYRYYSRWNLWQLDIIMICRKLSVPLEKVKQILDLHDNARTTQLLLEYRDEALRLSTYYKQVASDILWYYQENNRIAAVNAMTEVQMKWLNAETVIAGVQKREIHAYHANLQEACRDELQHSTTIQRKYGYILDPHSLSKGQVYKCREYLKITDSSYTHVKPENLYTIPEGRYAICIVHIKNDTADFGPLLAWLLTNHYETDAIYADELGMQLFDYIGDYHCEIKAHLTDHRS